MGEAARRKARALRRARFTEAHAKPGLAMLKIRGFVPLTPEEAGPLLPTLQRLARADGAVLVGVFYKFPDPERSGPGRPGPDDVVTVGYWTSTRKLATHPLEVASGATVTRRTLGVLTAKIVALIAGAGR